MSVRRIFQLATGDESSMLDFVSLTSGEPEFRVISTTDDLRCACQEVLGRDFEKWNFANPDRADWDGDARTTITLAATLLQAVYVWRLAPVEPWLQTAMEIVDFRLQDAFFRRSSGRALTLDEAFKLRRPPNWNRAASIKHRTLRGEVYHFVLELAAQGKTLGAAWDFAAQKYNVSPSQVQKWYHWGEQYFRAASDDPPPSPPRKNLPPKSVKRRTRK